jgi:hypothetical protein
LTRLRALRDRIESDAELLAFHQGKRPALPGFYRGLLKRRLGPYAELLTEDDLLPELEPLGAMAVGKQRSRPAAAHSVTRIGRRSRFGPASAAR